MITNDQGQVRITVQVVSMIDGSYREVVAWVKASDEQAAVDKLFGMAKDEIGYRFLGSNGLIEPSLLNAPSLVNPYDSQRYWARS